MPGCTPAARSRTSTSSRRSGTACADGPPALPRTPLPRGCAASSPPTSSCVASGGRRRGSTRGSRRCGAATSTGSATTRRALDPLRRHDTVVVRGPLDVAAMDEAARSLLGLHDFAAFCRRREGATTVRTLLDHRWARARRRHRRGHGRRGRVLPQHGARARRGGRPGGAGTPRGRRSARGARQGGVRDPRVRVMPPHGLSLEEVVYPPDAELAARAEEARVTPGAAGLTRAGAVGPDFRAEARRGGAWDGRRWERPSGRVPSRGGPMAVQTTTGRARSPDP